MTFWYELGFVFALFEVQALFQTGIDGIKWNRWDNWIENGKYLIPYESEFGRRNGQRTIDKALRILETVTSLKFVKYDRYTCQPGEPCNWYIKFQRSEGIFHWNLILWSFEIYTVTEPISIEIIFSRILSVPKRRTPQTEFR